MSEKGVGTVTIAFLVIFVVGIGAFGYYFVTKCPPATEIVISPESFTVGPGDSTTLTATLTSGGSLVAGKTITWSTTVGILSATSGVTDSSGQVSVTYTAPSQETTVTITASFGGGDQYSASSGSSSGTVALSSATLTISPESFTLEPGESTTLTATLKDELNAPLENKSIAWSTTVGDLSTTSGTTSETGQMTVTFTAPSYETTVTVTASFAGENQLKASSADSSGAITVSAASMITGEVSGLVYDWDLGSSENYKNGDVVITVKIKSGYLRNVGDPAYGFSVALTNGRTSWTGTITQPAGGFVDNYGGTASWVTNFTVGGQTAPATIRVPTSSTGKVTAGSVIMISIDVPTAAQTAGASESWDEKDTVDVIISGRDSLSFTGFYGAYLVGKASTA